MKKVDLFIKGDLIAKEVKSYNNSILKALLSDEELIKDYDIENSTIILGDVTVESFICNNNVLVLGNIIANPNLI